MHELTFNIYHRALLGQPKSHVPNFKPITVQFSGNLTNKKTPVFTFLNKSEERSTESYVWTITLNQSYFSDY